MKEEIFKAYEAIKPNAAAKERMLANILSAAFDMQKGEKEMDAERIETKISDTEKKMRIERKDKNMQDVGKETNMRIRKTGKEKWETRRKVQAVAALVLALSVPTVVAYAAGIFELHNLSLGKIVVEDPMAEVKEREMDVVSLQGTLDSPEAQACAEWLDYEEEYDKDEAILSEIGNNPTEFDEKYASYNCYTQEMADKIDEICEKYNLSLLSDAQVADTYQELCSQAGVGDFCSGMSENVYISVADGGIFYGDGSLSIGGEAMIGKAGAKACKTDFEFVRSVKGTFSPYYVTTENLDAFEEWEYITANGQRLLLARSDTKGLIVVDKEESFVVVNILGDILSGEFELDKETMERLAESFDFSVIK